MRGMVRIPFVAPCCAHAARVLSRRTLQPTAHQQCAQNMQNHHVRRPPYLPTEWCVQGSSIFTFCVPQSCMYGQYAATYRCTSSCSHYIFCFVQSESDDRDDASMEPVSNPDNIDDVIRSAVIPPHALQEIWSNLLHTEVR